jgi:hypothetical protein
MKTAMIRARIPSPISATGPDNGSAASLDEREDVLLGFVNTKAANDFSVFATGAPTNITEESDSDSSSRVDRAPYFPRSVL